MNHEAVKVVCIVVDRESNAIVRGKLVAAAVGLSLVASPQTLMVGNKAAAAPRLKEAVHTCSRSCQINWILIPPPCSGICSPESSIPTESSIALLCLPTAVPFSSPPSFDAVGQWLRHTRARVSTANQSKVLFAYSHRLLVSTSN